MDFLQHGEPCDVTASLQCRPVQCLQHAVDTRGVSVSVENKAGSSSLHRFNSTDVLLSVGVPDGRGVLQHQPDKGFVGPLFDTGVADLHVSSKESKSFVGLIADLCYLHLFTKCILS